MNRKGQAALEFLTTYGWAFLVILVMIGALSYFGILNPTKYVPDSCSFASPFQCDDAAVSSDTMTVRFRNNGEALSVSSIEVTDLDAGVVYAVDTWGVLLDATSSTCTAGASSIDCLGGQIATITINAASTDGTLNYATGLKKKFKVDIKYFYSKSGSAFTKATGGDIVATIS